jgi:hypothetical protein
MINSISGRIGNLVFYKRRGTQCVRVHVIPRNPDTEAQRIVRCAFGDAVRSWQAMTSDQKHEYIRKARYLNMSGYNLFISKYMKKVIQSLNLTSTDELTSLTWNQELSTWNFLPSPSVSKPYTKAYGLNAHSGRIKIPPG